MKRVRFRQFVYWLQTSLDWKLIPIYTLLYAAYRKRKDISSALRHCYHTFQQVLNVIDSGSNCFLKASNDLKDYFNGMGDDDVPISFVRLLRLFSSPEFLLIFRNISAGASQGICREFVARPQENKSKRRKSQQSEASNDRVAVLSKLLEAFVTPSGEHVASLIVSTAVREGLSTVFERYDRETAYASKKRKNGFAKSIHEDNQQKKETVEDFPPIVKALLDTALSDEGRKFMIDLSVAVTATAIPLVIRNVCKNQTNNLTPKLEPNIESYSTVGSNSKISKEELNKVSVSLHQRSTSSMLPFFRRQPNEMIDETSKEQSTPNNHWRGTSASSFFQKAAKLLGKEKKITEISDEKNHFQNVAEAPSASKESTKLKDETFIEKLFFTVFNDRQLLTDLAKTASYEAVRSYLLTQHELNSRNTTIKTTKRWTAPMTSKGVLCRKLCGDLFYQWLYHEGREPQWFFI
eukprot:jgi/Galph1/146/GphlegSOOS_G4909.1